MGAVSVHDRQRTRALPRRARIAIVAAAIASLGAYLFLSVLSQPLISGNAEGADRGTIVSSLSPGFDRPARVVDYADGATATLIKTWASPSFRPIQLDPSKQAPAVLHILMSHCEYNSPGGTASIDSIRIHDSVLGFPHVQDFSLNTLLAVKSPDSPT